MSPYVALPLDFDQVIKADWLITFPEDSPGAAMELGFWLAKSLLDQQHIRNTIVVWRGEWRDDDLLTNRALRGTIDLLQQQGNVVHFVKDHSLSLTDFQSGTIPAILEHLPV